MARSSHGRAAFASGHKEIFLSLPSQTQLLNNFNTQFSTLGLTLSLYILGLWLHYCVTDLHYYISEGILHSLNSISSLAAPADLPRLTFQASDTT